MLAAGGQVEEGEDGKALYTILCDMVGRTMNIVNEREETCIFIQKSTKTLIMNAALGAGANQTHFSPLNCGATDSNASESQALLRIMVIHDVQTGCLDMHMCAS